MFRFLMGGSASQPAPAAQQQQAVQPAASGGSDSRTVRTGLAKRVEEAEQQLAQAEIRLQTATAEMNAAAKANNSSGASQTVECLSSVPLRLSALSSPLLHPPHCLVLSSPLPSHTAVPGQPFSAS
jgi:hypothetical protein